MKIKKVFLEHGIIISCTRKDVIPYLDGIELGGKTNFLFPLGSKFFITKWNKIQNKFFQLPGKKPILTWSIIQKIK